jgi:uncharacterized membrane protein
MADLIWVLLISIISVPLVLLTTGVLRIAIALVLVLFLPGYSFTAALFPGKERLHIVERLAFSLGLSVAIVPLVCLILNYSPWGLQAPAILGSLILFVLIMSAIAWYRRRKLLPYERFQVKFEFLSEIAASLSTPGRLNKILTVVLVTTILGACVAFGLMITKNEPGEKFTEFYLLDSLGGTSAYPTQIEYGGNGEVIIGIVNQEYQSRIYTVRIFVGTQLIDELGPVTLEQGEKWEDKTSFEPQIPGLGQKIEFKLFEDSKPEPYRILNLWIDVI